MTIYNTTQICGDNLDIKFRRDGRHMFCHIEGGLTLEAKHIRALAAALDAYEAGEAALAEVAA